MQDADVQSRRRTGLFWIGTIPESDFHAPTHHDELPAGVVWCKGQLEEGEGGFRHWQVVVALGAKARLTKLQSIYGTTSHWELTRSSAANEYVWKEASRIGEQFEFGVRPRARNNKIDWDAVWEAAKRGDLDSVPSSIRVQSYRALRSIETDYSRPVSMERSVHVFWGRTGTGKSRRAWEESGLDAYPKDPRTKFWDGYQGEKNVVLDEFRGDIGISHLLRWFDRYPVRVEVKGSSRCLTATSIWITSNLDPESWFPDIDYQTRDALLRRLTIEHFE